VREELHRIAAFSWERSWALRHKGQLKDLTRDPDHFKLIDTRISGLMQVKLQRVCKKEVGQTGPFEFS
jgi:hypothetical protein